MTSKKHYIPNLDIVYPEKPDGHMFPFKKDIEITFDENYPFLDKSFKFRLKRFVTYLLIFTANRIVSFLRFGFKVEGRKNLRKNRKILKNGAMTISNHVQRWDFQFTQVATRYHTSFFPVWKEQCKGPDRGWIRYAGGIPIPDGIQAMKFFNKAFDEIREKKIWIHAYPESSRFDYYPYIRPFKKGVFTMAWHYNIPVLPVAITWRKPFPLTLDNIPRLFTGKKLLPGITTRVGEPLLFDESLPRKEAVQKMRKECHKAIVRLAGITNNPYPAESD